MNNTIRHNLIANLFASGWTVVIQLIFIPLYLKFLGIEAYGLIGFYITLQTVLTVMDLGLTPTITREMARYSVQPGRAMGTCNLLRTFEFCFWGIGIVIGIIIIFLARWIAVDWIKPSNLSIVTVSQTIQLMGLLIAVRWPIGLYNSALQGLQRQVILNVINVSMVTAGAIGALIILWKISPTLQAFFLWQAAMAGLQTIIISRVLWFGISGKQHACFDVALLSQVWRFAAGMSGITISAVILTQLDKVILSKLLPLESFGYYSLAWVIAGGLAIIITPVFKAIYPRFTVLVQQRDQEGIRQLYHTGTQLMSVLIFPITFLVSFFSYEIIWYWIGNAETARQAAPLVSMLIIGSSLNGLMNLPYALQLAHGNTTIGISINIFLSVIMIPTIIYMTGHFGVIGGATIWPILNSIYMLIGIPLTHRLLLIGDTWQWISKDVGLPLLATIIVILIGRIVFDISPSKLVGLTKLGGLLSLAILAAIFTSPAIRYSLNREIRLGYKRLMRALC